MIYRRLTDADVLEELLAADACVRNRGAGEVFSARKTFTGPVA